MGAKKRPFYRVVVADSRSPRDGRFIPALYDAFHKVENISKTKNISLKDPIEEYRTKDVYDVVGPICESSDIFVKDYRMAESQRGDLIAIRSCGAYGETMSSTYNLRPLAKSYTIDDFL